MTHEPFFSTTDASLTSFLRFPYDVRLEIYKYLLVMGRISYNLCLQKRRIVRVVYTYHPKGHYRYFRHGLFPAILECCRLVNEEATPILYGSNHFSVGCRVYDPHYVHVLNSWPMSERNLRLITSLGMSWYSDRRQYEEPAPTTAELLPQLFPALRAVTVVGTVSPADLRAFLTSYGDALAAVPTVECGFYVPDKTMYDIYRETAFVDEYPKIALDALEERCRVAYMRWTREPLVRDGKRVTWQSDDRSDQYGRCIYVNLLWEDLEGSHATKSESAWLAKRYDAQMST